MGEIDRFDVETKASMAVRLGCQGCPTAVTVRAEGLLSCLVATDVLGRVEGLPYQINQTVTTTVQHPNISAPKPTVMEANTDSPALQQPCPREWCDRLPQVARELASVIMGAGIPENVIQVTPQSA